MKEQEKIVYYIRIGELFVNDIVVDNDYINTYFIKEITLNAGIPKSFQPGEIKIILNYLDELGISEDSITIETQKLDDYYYDYDEC